MSDCMYFPDTVEEFMEQYKMTDTKQVYSNGTEYVPIFRMEQWFEHEKAQPSLESTTSDLISRQAVLDAIVQCTNCGDEDALRGYVLKHSLDNGWTGGILEALDAVKDLPTVQPEQHEGHWINGKCDLCGEHAPFWAMASTYHESNYCPCCGAKMKGVKHEAN